MNLSPICTAYLIMVVAGFSSFAVVLFSSLILTEVLGSKPAAARQGEPEHERHSLSYDRAA